MPWCRLGDNSATYPKLLMIAGFPGADERAINEVRGWLFACATQSAGHMTDYVIDPGTANMLGGSPARTKVLTRWCVRAGLLTPVKLDGITHWVIINDPEFIHIRTRAEVEWERQRRADIANTGITVPVRLRDGDNCRYCGKQVQWRGKKSNRSAEYDHRIPGQAATIDTLVVACRSCNGARQDNPQWDDDHPLRPAPAAPMYGAWTAQFLTENGYPTSATLEPDATTTSSADTAPTVERPAAQREAREATETRQPPGWAVDPEVPTELPPKSHSGSAGTGSPGSGRERTGGGSSPPTRTTSKNRRRGRRGGRSSTSSTGAPALQQDQHDQQDPAGPDTYDADALALAEHQEDHR